ncbi:MAG TPA: ClpXP protease specificity-enhancing factor [Zoogloea sp.]|uniref:ClpXP protease specificity-enhancing factor n=1 Tax=Zoogloea sp. TaxID=49181 RepID=UPI002B65EA32|nr:ClpXP protease specificity-enhancing factor [Zoogloea sp.]HMV18712.1 ClpXP protease specificity-enhancing factor [Rhodocyclaceae bacterium]HMV64593.1 ClpXP protease specificity-enhancing factor [Rhodocyclaceae bacterium]HMW52566.1 ClpXP protease specificity-enhancing factor [Rhodocyclaceae bacterium]HMY50763.1 ClpXP protease specificity-enhancing factor [Rhodocyclaceae bacterium]HMZ77438.1 ClpXP protease specificity-enhancing factor [Rhodocyclaceae bacterium]
MSEVSTKPYLIRAIFQWCVDQGLTPYLSVHVDGRTQVPRAFVQDGQIVLNVSMDATQNLVMGNELIAFQARFGGVAHHIAVPVDNVSAIYARENGHGMAFEVNPSDPAEASEPDATASESPPATADTPPDDGPKGGARGRLKLVK